MSSESSSTTLDNDSTPAYTFRDSLRGLADARMWWVFSAGFASGFPWVLTGACLSAWLNQNEIDKTIIGLFAVVASGYAINTLWGPMIDHVKIPYLSRFGQRRSWLLLCLLVMGILTLLISCLDLSSVGEPNSDPNVFESSWKLVVLALGIGETNALLWVLALLMVCIGYTGATLDLTTAAYRINVIKESEPNLVGLAASMEVAGWWAAFYLSAAIAFWTVDWVGWNLIYLSGAVVFFILSLIVVFGMKEPDKPPIQPIRRIRDLIDKTHYGALVDFFKRVGLPLMVCVLLFVVTFKLGEAFLGRMATVFYYDVGFTSSQIGTNSKFVSFFVAVSAAVVAGLMVGKFRSLPTLVIAGIAMAATNLMFSAMALQGNSMGFLLSFINVFNLPLHPAIGPSVDMFFWTAVCDGFTGGFSSVAFVTFITNYTSRIHSATQFAALASLGTLGRTTLSAASGFTVVWLNDSWSLFFVCTALAVIPALLLLYPISNMMRTRGIQ